MLNSFDKKRLRDIGCESTTQSEEVGREIEKGGKKMRNLISYLRDQQGIETLEWILIGGLITGVGIVLYPGVLQAGLSGVIGTIVAAITGAMPA